MKKGIFFVCIVVLLALPLLAQPQEKEFGTGISLDASATGLAMFSPRNDISGSKQFVSFGIDAEFFINENAALGAGFGLVNRNEDFANFNEYYSHFIDAVNFQISGYFNYYIWPISSFFNIFTEARVKAFVNPGLKPLLRENETSVFTWNPAIGFGLGLHFVDLLMVYAKVSYNFSWPIYFSQKKLEFSSGLKFLF